MLDGKFLLLCDFLDWVNFKVIFIKFVENEDFFVKEVWFIFEVFGEFVDDGILFDEKFGDGVFMVVLKMVIELGKYCVWIILGNGVFLCV